MKYRAFIVPAIGVIVLIVGFLMWGNLGDSLIYYLTPNEAIEQRADYPDGERFRLGGLVMEGSLVELDGGVEFDVSDGAETIHVIHEGAPPQLFAENVGVVVEGAWDGDVIRSNELLVRHDETYEAPEDPAHPEPYEAPEG
jgi:cytochrome c-type biogenesis protein CcmE